MSTHTFLAPAKLNLSLRVHRKRDDGFHEIETLMVKLPGLCDELVFQPSSAFSFECDDPAIPADESNLVVKAVRAYESATGLTCNFAISLKKNIPHGAGLGGGSSDAATALLALDQLHQGKAGAARLIEIAASLGSDIPFFLKPGAARCSGRGEIIQEVPSPAALRVVLLKPDFCVPTPDAYRRWAGSRELSGVSYQAQNLDHLSLVNDLEGPVFEKHRMLAELKEWLLERYETAAALLAGSGSCMFAVLHHGENAENLIRAAHHELDPGLWSWSGMTAK